MTTLPPRVFCILASRARVVAVLRRGQSPWLSPQAFDDLTEQKRFVTAVDEGLGDVEAGRVHAHAEVKRRMHARFGTKAR